ncbi:response regulator transcription factor [Pedococcus bigeumensis]|uniref:response regulator transcription factor n=1 Tax=Pedococcus bigeumensis TaxID=433644 RepID=UPI001F50205D|nr:response regulator transcription factor [Pedococcus bigeumensis]
MLREGLAGLFRDAGHEVVASLGDCDGLEDAVREHSPHVVVLDVRMPPSFTDEGTRAAAALKSAWPDLGVVLLSQHIETAHSVELAGLGGFGYLLKDRVLDVSEFLGAVARVAEGGSALDPQVTAALLNRKAPHDSLAQLTEREHEVLGLMAQGMTNTGIAKRLVLSERTVEAHARRLLQKLDIADSEDANRRVHAVLLHLGVRPPATAEMRHLPRP